MSQVLGSAAKFGPLRVEFGHSRQADLEADKLSPIGLTLFVKPVGVDQPRGVVVGMFADRRQEGAVGGGVEHFPHSTAAGEGSRAWLDLHPAVVDPPFDEEEQ